ncbi:hypothetical protein STANM309S_01665 [Streptomyces tanashiensis]
MDRTRPLTLLLAGSLAAGGFLALTPAAQAADTELARNGGFEAGLDGWTCTAGSGAVVPSPVHGGTKALQATPAGSGPWTSTCQVTTARATSAENESRPPCEQGGWFQSGRGDRGCRAPRGVWGGRPSDRRGVPGHEAPVVCAKARCGRCWGGSARGVSLICRNRTSRNGGPTAGNVSHHRPPTESSHGASDPRSDPTIDQIGDPAADRICDQTVDRICDQICASAASMTSRPSFSRSSPMTSGGRKRSTLP